MVPNDPRSPLDPSGIRLGVPLLTSRGMKEGEMKQIGEMLSRVLNDIRDEKTHQLVADEVKTFCQKFPI